MGRLGFQLSASSTYQEVDLAVFNFDRSPHLLAFDSSRLGADARDHKIGGCALSLAVMRALTVIFFTVSLDR